MAQVGPIGIDGLGQVAFAVSDLDETIRFFRDTLGIPLLFTAPPGLAFFDLNGVRLMVSRPEGNSGAAVGRNSILYLRCPDLTAACSTMKERRVHVSQSPHMIARMGDTELWMAFIRDPDGNLNSLMEEIPAKTE